MTRSYSTFFSFLGICFAFIGMMFVSCQIANSFNPKIFNYTKGELSSLIFIFTMSSFPLSWIGLYLSNLEMKALSMAIKNFNEMAHRYRNR